MSRATGTYSTVRATGALIALFACIALLFSLQTAYADESSSSADESGSKTAGQLEAGSIDFDYMKDDRQPAQSGDLENDEFADMDSIDDFIHPTVSEGQAEADALDSDGDAQSTRWRRPKGAVSYAVFPYVPNPSTEAFIASIAEPAREIGQKEGLYASVMIAQAILESGSGSSGLSKPPYNNLFGIKGSYKGASVVLMTSEDDGTGGKYDIAAGFRRYPSVKESLEDYADLLKRSMGAFYAPAWKANAKTYVEACNYLQGHYATDTSYSGKLQGLIIAYDLTRYDHPAGWSAKTASKEERVADAQAAFAHAGNSAVAGSEARAAQSVADAYPDSPEESTASSTGEQEPLRDPGVQLSLVSLGALAILFSKNEIALLLAAAKAHIGFIL